MGYDETQINRERALKRLGMTEEQMSMENSKTLGSLGYEGRKRSTAEITGNTYRSRTMSAPQLARGKRSSWFARSIQGHNHPNDKKQSAEHHNGVTNFFKGLFHRRKSSTTNDDVTIYGADAGAAAAASRAKNNDADAIVIQGLELRYANDQNKISQLESQVSKLKRELSLGAGGMNTIVEKENGNGAAALGVDDVEIAAATDATNKQVHFRK
jgi:hypothetical protein